MYVLHSLDFDLDEHSELVSEAWQLNSELADIDEMWFLMNLQHKEMYMSDGTLPLDEDGLEYCYIVLVNKNKQVILGRHGKFSVQEEPGNVYWSNNPFWIDSQYIKDTDSQLYNLLKPLWN